MNILCFALFILLINEVESIPFDRSHPLFGVVVTDGITSQSSILLMKSKALSARGGSSSSAADDEGTQVVKAIADAIDNVEHRIQHAIEEEVNMFFHGIEHHEDGDDGKPAKKVLTKKQENAVAKAKESVAKGAKKVRKIVEEHPAEGIYDIPFMKSHYPYEWPHADPHADHKVLHAVEAAEKAVLHAVEDEVQNLFHDLKDDHHDHDIDKKTRKAITDHAKRGVESTKKLVDEKREDRRNWLSTEMDRRLDAYEYFLQQIN